jgi:hypothetical protein
MSQEDIDALVNEELAARAIANLDDWSGYARSDAVFTHTRQGTRR